MSRLTRWLTGRREADTDANEQANGGHPADEGDAEGFLIGAGPSDGEEAVPVPPAPDRPAPVPCPSCAALLDPPPVRNRRCPRCRQVIVVRRYEGRTVYLTEAAVDVFERERRRQHTLEQWRIERSDWLRLGAGIGVPRDRLDRIRERPLDADSVAAAREAYESAVTKAIKAAAREHQWEVAARRGRDLAAARHRAEGMAAPPDPVTAAVHATAMVALLRSIAPLGTHAEMVGARCCAVCRADDGRLFAIAPEIRAKRLPHAGCPRGLCGCEWWLGGTPERPRRRRKARPAPAPADATAEPIPAEDPAPEEPAPGDADPSADVAEAPPDDADAPAV